MTEYNDLEGERVDFERLRRRMVLRRQLLYALFYLGTLLAVIGWYVDIKHVAEFNPTIGKLSVLAVIGHALQVGAVFGLLLLPDEIRFKENHEEVRDNESP